MTYQPQIVYVIIVVRPKKNKSIKRSFQKLTASALFLPLSIFVFVLITSPIIYFTTQRQIDLRQRAATITGGGIAIDTDEISYKDATSEVLPADTLNVTVGIIIATIVVAGGFSIYIYRKKVSSF